MKMDWREDFNIDKHLDTKFYINVPHVTTCNDSEGKEVTYSTWAGHITMTGRELKELCEKSEGKTA